MAKAYWIVRVDVNDPTAYQAYIKANAAAFKKYGGRFIIRGAAPTVLEGEARSRNVVIEFADRQTALDCWHSAEYQAAKQLRDKAATSDLIVIDGYDGPQPG